MNRGIIPITKIEARPQVLILASDVPVSFGKPKPGGGNTHQVRDTIGFSTWTFLELGDNLKKRKFSPTNFLWFFNFINRKVENDQ